MKHTASKGPKQSTAFRNSYVAAFLIVAALFLSNNITAQTAPSRDGLNTVNTLGNNNRNGAYRNILYIPMDTIATADSGAIAFLNAVLYQKNSDYWRPVGKAIKLNDSTIVIGSDTLTLRGTPVTSVGDGYTLIVGRDTLRSIVPFGPWLKIDTVGTPKIMRMFVTPAVGYGMQVDPFTDTAKIDTARGIGVPTPFYIDSFARKISWGITGNLGTNATDNFIGTADFSGLAFRTNNIQRALIGATGNVLIGTSMDNGEKLQVFGTATASTSLISPTIQGQITSSGNITIKPNSSSTGGSILFGSGSILTNTSNDNRLGVNTTSPSNWGDFVGNVTTFRGIQINNQNGAPGSGALLRLSTPGTNSEVRVYNRNTNPGYLPSSDTLSTEFRLSHSTGGGYVFVKPSGSSESTILKVYSSNAGFTSADLIFYVNGTGLGAGVGKVPSISSITTEKVLVQDGTTGQFKSISPGSLTRAQVSDSITSVLTVDVPLTAFSGYDRVEIQFEMQPATDNRVLFMRVSPDGINFDAGATDYEWGNTVNITGNGTGSQSITSSNTGGASEIRLSSGLGNSSDETCRGRITIYEPNHASFRPTYTGEIIGNSTSGLIIRNSVFGQRQSAQQTRAVRFYLDSGSFARFKYRVIGYRN